MAVLDIWPNSWPWLRAFSLTGRGNLLYLGFLVAQMVENLPGMQEIWVQSLGQEDPLEKGMVTHSSILSRRIPWTEEPGGLQSMGLQRTGHDWATFTHSLFCIYVRCQAMQIWEILLSLLRNMPLPYCVPVLYSVPKVNGLGTSLWVQMCHWGGLVTRVRQACQHRGSSLICF